MNPFLRAVNLSKKFGKLQPLNGVSLEVYPGEVVGIVGSEGAGKSVLVHLLAGVYAPDAGQLYVDGAPVVFDSARDAHHAGIEVVFSEPLIAENMDITKNIFAGRPVYRSYLGDLIRVLDTNEMKRRAARILKRLRLSVPSLNTPLRDLPQSHRHAVQVARSLCQDFRLLILDDVLRRLHETQRRCVLDIIPNLRDNGQSVLLVTENINYIFMYTDRVIILYQGNKVGEGRTSEITEEEVVSKVVGSSQADDLMTPVVWAMTSYQRVREQARELRESREMLDALNKQLQKANRELGRLYSSEQERRHLAESLRGVAEALSSTLDLTGVLNLMLEHLQRLVPYGRAAVLLQRGEVMEIITSRGFPADKRTGEFSVMIEEGDVFNQLKHTREPLVIPDVTQTVAWQQADWLPLHRAWLGIPLITALGVIGMLSMTREPRGAFSTEDVDMATTIANQAAIAIENAQLYENLEQLVAERTEELSIAYENLSRLDKTKSDFIRVAGHELRTPLTVIHGYSKMLMEMESVKQDAVLCSSLAKIGENTQRLSEIVNTMLDVSRIDSQSLQIIPEETDLQLKIHEVVTHFAPALKERNLTLRLERIETLPRVVIDPDAFYKVLTHIVTNAIKYTPDGGYITITGRVGRVVDGEWSFTGDDAKSDATEIAELREARKLPELADGKWIWITVADTGIGIAEEHQELIFEKFYQTGDLDLHSSGKTKFKGGGAGLGLTIAKGIIEAHGGYIRVDSPGCDEQTCPGSRFHIWLPRGAE